MTKIGNRATAAAAHILLVDDDRQVIEYLKAVLEKSAYIVTGTTSGKLALALIRENMPDLMILDLNMPEPDGFEVLKTERAQFPYLKTIVISGYLHGALLDAAKYFGAVATLPKPVSPDELLAKVRDILGPPQLFVAGVRRLKA